MSKNLPQDAEEWRRQGFETIGFSEFAAKGNLGVRQEVIAQAMTVGASVVLFRIWPAKFRSIKYLPNGLIDMDGVLADPPRSRTPSGYYVIKAIFLRSRRGQPDAEG